MANFKIGRGMQDGIPETLTDGMLYYCTDTTNLFIDYTDSNGNLVRSQLSANYADKLRYVADGATVEIDPKDIALDSEVLHKNQPEYTNNMIGFIRDDDTIENPKRVYVNPDGVHAISSIEISNQDTDNERWTFKGFSLDKNGLTLKRRFSGKDDYVGGYGYGYTIIDGNSDKSNIIFGNDTTVALYANTKEEGSSGTLVYTMKEDNDLELANKQYVDTNIADAVKYSEQTLTEEQKAQARINIGSISQDELPAATQSTFGAVKVENVVTNAVGGSGQYNSIYINEAGVIVSAKSVKYFETMDQVSNQNTVNGCVAVVKSKGTSTIDVVYPAIVISTTNQSYGHFDGWIIDAEGNYYTCSIWNSGINSYTKSKYGLPTPTSEDNNKVLSVSEGVPIWTDVSIPSKTSDLTNDSGFLTAIPDEYVTDDELTAKGYLTSYTETDPTVPDWAKQPTKPTYTADEVGALPDTTAIPTNISELNNDSGYLTSIPTEYITETELEAKGYLTSYTETDPTVPEWAKSVTKPTYTASEVGALPDTTAIPTKTSDLTNDSGYLTVIPSEYITETELAAYGYLTSYTETDPTVPAWAKEANKPTYTAAEVGALPADTVIPSIDGLATESYVDTAVATKITTPTTATVGQILSVKSVDTNGAPTEWETVDYNSVTEDRVNELITAALATTQSYYTGTSDPEDSLGSDGDIYLKTT